MALQEPMGARQTREGGIVQRMNIRRNLVQHSLGGLLRLVLAAPWSVVLLAVTLAAVSLWYTVTHLDFQTSRNALVPQKARYIERYREAKNDFTDLDPLIVAVEPPQVERGKQFVEALAARLRADTQHFEKVTAQDRYQQPGREKTAAAVARRLAHVTATAGGRAGGDRDGDHYPGLGTLAGRD